MSSVSEQEVKNADPTSDILAGYFDRLWISEEAAKIRRVIERVKLPLHEQAHTFVRNRCDIIKRLLEVGPGHGWDAERFRRIIPAYSGIEVSLESCRSLKSGHGLSMIRGLAEKLPILPGSLDCVYISTTLMHLQKKQTIEDIALSLAAGGYFILVEPFGTHPLVQIYRKFKYRNLPYAYLNRADLACIKDRFQTLEEHYFGLLFVADTRVDMLNRVLQKIDSWLFHFRFFRRFAWMYLGIYKSLK